MSSETLIRCVISVVCSSELQTRAFGEGRHAAVDSLFRVIEIPPPTLHWAPDDDFLAGSSPLRFLSRFWHDHRAAADLPPSSAIDPFALGPALGILMLLEPIDGGKIGRASCRERVWQYV